MPFQGEMEEAFGEDFSTVEAHAGKADALTPMGAKAAAVGESVVFGDDTPDRQTVAHELTHVVQARRGTMPEGPSTKAQVTSPNDPIEREAEAAALSIAAGRPPVIGGATGEGGLHLSEDPGLGPGTEDVGSTPEDDGDLEQTAYYTVTTPEGAVELTEEQYRAREDELVTQLDRAITGGTDGCEAGREAHDHHITEVRGAAGVMSDWWNDVYPPWIGMWGIPEQAFARARERLDERNLKGAQSDLIAGYESLARAQDEWHRYINESVVGAEGVVSMLETIRDGAIALEVGLLTGGIFAAGATTIGAVTAGGAATMTTAALLPTEAGEVVRGTLAEIIDAGHWDNLSLAAHGMWGMILGMGEGLSAMLEGLATLFTDPAKLLVDLARLPSVIAALYDNRGALVDAFCQLPPDQQAQDVGQFVGHLEAFLASLGAAHAAGAALGGAEISVSVPVLVPGLDGEAVIGFASAQLLVLQQEVVTTVTAVGQAIAHVHSMAIAGAGGAPGQAPPGHNMSDTHGYNVTWEDGRVVVRKGQPTVPGPHNEMFGANGTKVMSKTVWKGGGRRGPRIDVENPQPGQRPGQIHFQRGSECISTTLAPTHSRMPRMPSTIC